MLEVYDVVTGGERPRRGGHGSLSIASRTPKAAGAAEDLVVREHSQSGHHEPCMESANRQREIRRQPHAWLVRPSHRHQFLQTLELALVVTK